LRKAFDIKVDSLAPAIVQAGASLNDPIFVIWEGGSMYFKESEANTLIRQIKALMSLHSEFWFDHISADAVTDRTGLPEVKLFMDSMRMIGEPFVRGFENVKLELANLGLRVLERVSAAEMLESVDPVFQHYAFARCGA
jgi:O-methyltransferase involved in polyketide biosynthesis